MLWSKILLILQTLSLVAAPTRVILGGDVMLGRSVMTRSNLVRDYGYPFRQIADFTKRADLFFVNLEAPFFENCPKTDTGMVFCTDPVLVQGLVDAVNLENNHILNYGQEGLSKTKEVLSKKVIDAGADVIAGHHPHRVQNWGYLEGKPVFYSLGNLIFDQMRSEKTKQGMLAEITVENKKITNVKTYNTYMRNFAQPEIIQ